jgi:hypothetical protein
MGSSRKSKSGRAKGAYPDEQPPIRKTLLKVLKQARAEVSEIPPGVINEIENQRGVLVTVITLLHCLHVVLERNQTHIDDGLNPRIEAVARLASLPEMTAMLLERTHAVLSALDSVNLENAFKARKP